jgi:Mrp family chromosome partitioning ATPase
MVDLTAEMAQLWASLRAPWRGQTRIVQFAAARSGEGTSTIAREFAYYAAPRVQRPVWLVDADLLESPQQNTIAARTGRYGGLGRQTDASPDGSAFFSVRPPEPAGEGEPIPTARFLVAYPVGGARLWVTRFRRELLQPWQKVEVEGAGGYWEALRRHAGLIVVDAPAADRSAASAVLAPLMDFTILVVAADLSETQAPADLKRAITKAGGRCEGLFLNKAAPQPPALLRSL